MSPRSCRALVRDVQSLAALLRLPRTAARVERGQGQRDRQARESAVAGRVVQGRPPLTQEVPMSEFEGDEVTLTSSGGEAVHTAPAPHQK